MLNYFFFSTFVTPLSQESRPCWQTAATRRPNSLFARCKVSGVLIFFVIWDFLFSFLTFTCYLLAQASCALASARKKGHRGTRAGVHADAAAGAQVGLQQRREQGVLLSFVCDGREEAEEIIFSCILSRRFFLRQSSSTTWPSSSRWERVAGFVSFFILSSLSFDYLFIDDFDFLYFLFLNLLVAGVQRDAQLRRHCPCAAGAAFWSVFLCECRALYFIHLFQFEMRKKTNPLF